MIGVDYSVRPYYGSDYTAWLRFGRSLLAKNRTFVGRYLASDHSRMYVDKRAITPEEVQAFAELGIAMFFWWENAPDHQALSRQRRALQGREAGRQDAVAAVAMARALGCHDPSVYFTVDTDTTGRAVSGYFVGLSDEMDLARIGVYGGYEVVKSILDQKLATFACQTEAWSYKKWDHRAQLRQYVVTKSFSVDGVGCDTLEAAADWFGQWHGEEELMVHESDVKTAALEVVGANYQLGNEPWYDIGWEPSSEPLASDCSGLIYGVFRKCGVTVNGKTLPRLPANDYWKMTTPIYDPKELKCGDVGVLVKNGHADHIFLVVDSEGTVVEAGYDGKVRETMVAIENARTGVRWGRWQTNIKHGEGGVFMALTHKQQELLLDTVLRNRVSLMAACNTDDIAIALAEGDVAKAKRLLDEANVAAKKEKARLGLK